MIINPGQVWICTKSVYYKYADAKAGDIVNPFRINRGESILVTSVSHINSKTGPYVLHAKVFFEHKHREGMIYEWALHQRFRRFV